jgi:flagella basal body P-ring formation protein FlgA
VLLLSDLVTLSGSDSLIHEITETPIAPAPRLGQKQTWSRESIAKALSLRGIPPEAIRWKGAAECCVLRVEGVRQKPEPNPNATKQNSVQSAEHVGTGTQDFATLAAANQSNPSSLQSTNPESPAQPAIDRSLFVTPFTTPVVVTQAERISSEIISNYLQTKTNSVGRWIIKPNLPPEHAKLLSQRGKIKGVAGGQPPWEGEQEFVFLVKGPNGEQSIPVQANVKLPEMVVAANRALSKGYVLKEEDLAWIQMPRGSSFGAEDCFSDIERLVGKQLRRAMSTQQVIRLSEVGPPTVIHVGDVVAIEVVSGQIAVETLGRAVESGGIDDLIQIDIMQVGNDTKKSRVHARITGERSSTGKMKAELFANGSQPPSAYNANSSQANPKR